MKENAVKDEFVFLSVVMAAQKAGQKHFNTEARGLLEESGECRPVSSRVSGTTMAAQAFMPTT